MKAGWQKSTLGDVLDVLRNGVNCKQDKSGIGEKISRIESISGAWFDIDKVGYAELSEKDKPRYILKRGDILFSHINSPVHVGKTAIFDSDEPVYHGVNLLLMRPKELVTSDYLDHALKYLFQCGYWRGVCKQSVNQASVNQQDISKVEINFPKSIPEQQRIVGILDEAFDGIATAKANAEKNLRNARALFESHLQSVFAQRGEGWVGMKKPLADLCELIVDCEHKTAPTQEEGFPSIRTPNIGKGKLQLDGVYRVSEETYRDWTRRAEPKAGDLIFAREAPAGNVGVIPENLKVCLGQRTVLIRPKRDVFESEFLALILLQPCMQQKFLDHSRGATVQHVNMKDIRALNVGKIPPLTVQRDIVSAIDSASVECERLESIYQQKLAALDALKKSLLDQAFTGQL